MNEARERPRHLRQGKRLNSGAFVVAEYDATGCVVSETYYYASDEAWLMKILERNESAGSPRAS